MGTGSGGKLGSGRGGAGVAQLVEHFLGKEEVHRFNPGRGLHLNNYLV